MDLSNPEAESFLLAGIVRHPEDFYAVDSKGVLAPEDFLGTENRRVFKAIRAAVDDHKTPDLPILLEYLRLAGNESTTDYVSRLMLVPCTTERAAEYATIVKGLAVNRALVKAGARIMEVAGENRDDPEAAISEADSLIRKVRENLPDDERSADPADIMRRLRSAVPTDIIRLTFSPSLQRLSGGLEPGLIWVVGGFSSTGKSAFAVNALKDVLDAGKWAAVISLEMPAERYMVRLLSLYSGVPQRTIRDRVVIGLEQAERLRRAEDFLTKARLRIWDTTYRLAAIRARAIHMKETMGLDVLVLDFLQNLRGTYGDQFKDLTEAIIELQQLAKELHITVIVMSQLSDSFSRQSEGIGREYTGMKGKFQWYSFKGSGAVRDAADFGIILMRERNDYPNSLNCHVVKNRDGEMETIPMQMDLPTGRISEWKEEAEDED